VTAQLRGLTSHKYVALEHVDNPHGVQVQPNYVTAQLRGLTSQKYVTLEHGAYLHEVEKLPITWAHATRLRGLYHVATTAKYRAHPHGL
jgi:hypothetical protein